MICGNTREDLIDIPDNEKGPPVCLENEELSDEGHKEGNDEVADEVSSEIESDHGDDIEEGDGLNVKPSVGEDNIKLHDMIEKCDTSSSIDDLDGGIISSESALGNAEDHDLYDDESEKKVIDDVHHNSEFEEEQRDIRLNSKIVLDKIMNSYDPASIVDLQLNESEKLYLLKLNPCQPTEKVLKGSSAPKLAFVTKED